MTFYSEVAAIAAELLAEFGAVSTLTRTTSGGYDPETGTVIEPATTVYPCTLAVFPVEDRFIDGTAVLRGDQTAYVSAVGLGDPIPGDAVAWRGADYQVIRGEVLAPAGEAVLYTLQLRK